MVPPRHAGGNPLDPAANQGDGSQRITSGPSAKQ